MLRAWRLWTIGLLFVVGCATGGGGSAGGGGEEGAGGDDGGAACTDLTYENFAAGFFDSFCTRCHSSALSGADRNGAPAGLDWDQLDVVRENLDRIRVRATELNTMPPSEPRPEDDERTALAEWIGCGAPSEGD
ncbi:MAG: cytochrome c [bacterium]|nr:cytochrome c [bacterium]